MDQSLFHLINGQWTSPLLDLFMAALSDSKIWEPLFVAVGVSALFFGGFRGRAFVICLALSLLITNELIDVITTFFLSVGESLLLIALFESIWRIVGRKWMPQLFARHPSLVGHSNGRARPPGAPQPSI